MAAGLYFYSFAKSDFAVIEIIGLPGSGKSFLSESLLDFDGWQVDPCSGRTGRRWLTPLTLLRCPIVSILLAGAAVVANGRRETLPWRFRQAVRLVRKYDQIKRLDRRGLHVVDEGPVPTLWTIFFDSPVTDASRWFMRQALRRISRDFTAFVCLDVPRETCVGNARARHQPQSWFHRGMSEDVAQRLMSDNNQDEIVKALETVAPDKVRRFKNTREARDFILAWAGTKPQESIGSMHGPP